MPTYEYECAACGRRLEIFQAITARPLKKCPRCERRTLTRLIGAGAGVLFKGSGFYHTDYRSDSYKKAAQAEKGEAKPVETKPGSPAKPAADAQPAQAPAKADSPASPTKPKPKARSQHS